MDRLRRYINICVGAALLVCGVGGLSWLIATKPVPTRSAIAYPVPRVELLAIEPALFDQPIIGYGTVRPKRQVKIIPEVGGRLVTVHDDLAEGNYISKGDLLFEIDSRVYQAKVSQVEAEIRRLEAELRRHEQQRTSLQNRLEIAREQERLARVGFERDEKLNEKGTSVADPEVERSKERYLKHKDNTLAYESELGLIPIQIDETTALLETKRSQLAEARLNVEKTKIFCPFDARVDAITAQESQVVIASLQIATLTDMEALEIPVVIDPRELRWTDQRAFAQAVGQDVECAPEAKITWTLHGQEYTWSGKITRLERMDEVTRSAHLVVEVRDIMRSLEVAKGDSRPPMSVGMFCKAELPPERLEDAMVVPRHSIHDEQFVYVFEPDPNDAKKGRLAIRRVPILRGVGDDVLVAFGADNATELQPGDLVVVSPLSKVVEGMRLERRDAERQVATQNLAPARMLASTSSTTPLLGAVTGAQ